MPTVNKCAAIVPLTVLRPNEHGNICDIAGEECMVHRLAEMGIRVGALLKMMQPGFPCIVCVEGQRFSLRLDDEVHILVEAAV